MERLLLKNLCILNPGGSPGFIENGHILVEGGTIASVGSGEPLVGGFDKTVDMAGKTVLPGMINAHTHLYSTLALGMPLPRKPPADFAEILRNIWWVLDRALDLESTRASFEAGLLECLRAGVTTVIDHHSSQNVIDGSLDLLVETAESFGMNVSPCFEATDRNGKDAFEAALAENLGAFKKHASSSHVRPLLGLHASFTLSDESLAAVADAIDGHQNIGIHIHLAEDRADEQDARSRGYRSVVGRLESFNLLNPHGLAIHGIHIAEEDTDILRESGMKLVHNPTSNANNRVGVLSGATIQALDAGLGTDGMQANMLKEAKEGALLRSQHLTGGEPDVDYLSLLFVNNPGIAGTLFGREIGFLQPGCPADMAFYDYRPRTSLSGESMAGHILYGLDLPSDVMSRGCFRLRDGRFVEIQADEILANARVRSAELWKAMSRLKA